MPLVPVFSVKELPEEELKDDAESDDAGKNTEISFLKGLGLLLKNKYFLVILVLYLVMYLASGITGGMGIYFATYQLGDASLLGLISMAGMLPVVIALPFVPQITTKFGMRNSAIIGHAIGTVGGIMIIVGGLGANFTLVLVGLIIKAIGSAPQTGALTAIIAEAGEYSYLKTGYRITGTIYSCASVGVKVGTGLGTALCGFLLDLGGFDGTAAVQTATAISTINWSYLLASALVPILSIVVFYFLNVEKENKKLRNQK